MFKVGLGGPPSKSCLVMSTNFARRAEKVTQAGELNWERQCGGYWWKKPRRDRSARTKQMNGSTRSPGPWLKEYLRFQTMTELASAKRILVRTRSIVRRHRDIQLAQVDRELTTVMVPVVQHNAADRDYSSKRLKNLRALAITWSLWPPFPLPWTNPRGTHPPSSVQQLVPPPVHSQLKIPRRRVDALSRRPVSTREPAPSHPGQ